MAPFVETRANGEGTAIHSEGESSSGALAREQKQEQETEEQQEKHMEELKQAAMARHERWGLFAGENAENAEPKDIPNPEEKIDRWERLADESPNEDLQKDLRNLAAWSKTFQNDSTSGEERVTAVRSIHRILHDLDVHYNGNTQEPYGVTHVRNGDNVDERVDISS